MSRVFSISATELLTIAVVALLLFGPRRLPEIARRAGRLLRQAREAVADLRSGLESDYEETVRPLDDLWRQMGATLEDPAPGKGRAEPRTSGDSEDPEDRLGASP
jgi:TatA/E family protein of Tat protein translocase